MKPETTIEDQIVADLSSRGRGRIFFAQDYYNCWPESSVRFALSGLAKEGRIARLARGVFCFPEVSEYGMQMILPGPQAIAEAIAEKTHVRISPYGDYAAHVTGLAGFLYSSTTYLTDGAPRKIHLSGGRTIEFRHTSEMRIFAFQSRKMQLISNAIRAVGKERIGAEERETLKWQLDSVTQEEFAHDVQLCPEWVRDILLALKA